MRVARSWAETPFEERAAIFLRLDRDDPIRRLAAQLPAQEREGQPREVGAAAGATDDDVRLLAGHRHLLDRLLPDDRLMQQHVVEDRTQRVLRVVPAAGVLDRLTDGDPERSG